MPPPKRKDVIRGYRRELSKLGMLNAKTEDEVRNRMMDRQRERPKATEPEIIEGTGAAPPGIPPPSATRTADLTEPRPEGGVFDSKGSATPDKGPASDEIRQSDLPTAPRPRGGVSDSVANATATDFFNQLAAPELAQSQALTDFVQQHPKAAAAEGAVGLGVVLGIPAAGAAGLLGAGATAMRAAVGGRNPFGIGPYAGESIPARSAARNFTRAERAEINRIGAKTGCHTCGTKNPGTMYGNFVLDHQTPSALNWEGAAQRLYPQCKACSDAQGLGIIRLLSRLRGPR
jgi:hypothetical protein